MVAELLIKPWAPAGGHMLHDPPPQYTMHCRACASIKQVYHLLPQADASGDAG